MINFSDITAYKRLEQEKEMNRLLKTLNTSVHHEMLTPLKANVDIAKRMINLLKTNPQIKEMA